MKVKIKNKVLILVLVLSVSAGFTRPRISQVDNSAFALNNEISIYVNADNNRKLNKNNFKAYEKVINNGETQWNERQITRFMKPDDIGKGINFVLLVDVSGSMAGRKIKSTREAIISFIQSAGKNDNFKIITFGKTVEQTKGFTKDKNALINATINIKSPDKNAPTPLYFAAVKALKGFNEVKGRKVVILLSDGVNDLRKDGYNDLSHFNKIPTTTLNETIKSTNKTGIPVYSIGFECNTREMSIISAKSGGKYYAFTRASELKNIYNEIRYNVLSEYKLTYKTDIGGPDVRQVYVMVNNGKSNVRDYYAGSILGTKYPLNSYLIIALMLALGVLILLYFIRFSTKRKLSEITVLKGKSSAHKIALDENPIIIGRNEKSNMGLFGDKKIANYHAKIMNKSGKYFIERLDENFPVLVDKKKTHKCVLHDGDVIQIGSSLLVFNEKDEVA